jgi:hypothetical protein
MAVKEKKNGKVSETESKQGEKVSSSIHERKEKPAEKAEKVTRYNHMRSILKQYYNY